MNDCASNIASDETVALFATAARFDSNSSDWIAPIHGWVYEPETESRKRRAAIGALRRILGISDDEETELFRQRVRFFLVDNERGKRICVRATEAQYTLPESGANGHFTGSVILNAPRPQADAVSSVPLTVALPSGDTRRFEARVALLPPTGFSVISDIDDTIKVSDVRDRSELLRNTFLREFESVPGMSRTFAAFAERGVSFHYVSSSPWQLYEDLLAMMTRDGFPVHEMRLKQFRLKDNSALDLFASPEDTKPKEILDILDRFPERMFLLIGDDGEKDPEVFGDIARRRPGQVIGVAIRAPARSDQPTNRFSHAFEGLHRDQWLVFSDPELLHRFLHERIDSHRPPSSDNK